MKQKIYSAYESKADVLILSIDNKEEALETYNKLKNKEELEIIFVSTFTEVIECLR